MFDTLNRPYKKLNPRNTIEKIQFILKRINLVPGKVLFYNPYPEIYSTRIQLSEAQGGKGTNGKGRTEEYCLASAYAEFMERLQNNILGTLCRPIISKLKDKYGFYYTADERYMKKEEFQKLPEDIIKDFSKPNQEFIDKYFEQACKNNESGITAIPFYDTKNKRIIYMPINLLIRVVGSNGMAAGNTKSEAIFQALCELMERWSASEIFYNQITPPTISKDFLSNFSEEYKIIKELEKSGKYNVIIKDFSANNRIPAIGVLIINKENHKYRLNVGCDTCFQVALSRSLTEIYQGMRNDQDFDNISLDIPQRTPDYFTNKDENSQCALKAEFDKFTKNGTGTFPVSLFNPTSDYSFDSTVFSTKDSYEKEVESIILNFHHKGYNVYIRDNSYLEFPAMLVYIPGVSDLGSKNTQRSLNNKFDGIEVDKIEELFFNFDNCTIKDMLNIEKVLSNIDYTWNYEKLFNLEFKEDSVYSEINIGFIVTLLQYKLEKYDEAIKSLDIFRKNRKQDNIYYEIVNEYLKLKRDGIDSKNMLDKILSKGYPHNIAIEVCEDLADSKNVFKHTPLPKCPNCNDCKLREQCLTSGQFQVYDKLYVEMKKNIIDQNLISNIVYAEY